MPGGARLPNLLVIGVSKGGTTSLFHYLGQHPDVCASEVKELRYFVPLRWGQEPGALHEYASHWRRCAAQRYAMEATPGYFNGGLPVARGIERTLPGVRALLSLRAPEDRCWSWYRFVRSRGRIPPDMSFDAYLDRCAQLHHQGLDGDPENQAYWGLGGGCYSRWLDGWTDLLGDRLRIVFFDDVVSEPAATVVDICSWLGIDTAPVQSFDFAVDNVTVQYRNRSLQLGAIAVNRKAERYFRRHLVMKRRLRRIYYAVNRGASDDTMSPAARERLEQFYRPYAEELARQLSTRGLSLPASWRTQS